MPKRSSPVVLVASAPEPKSDWIARRGVLVTMFVVCLIGLSCVIGLVHTIHRHAPRPRDSAQTPSPGPSPR